MTTNIHQLFVGVDAIARASQANRGSSGGGLSAERVHYNLKHVQSTPMPTAQGKNGARRRLYRVADVLPVLQALPPRKWTSAATLHLIENEAATLEQINEQMAHAAEMDTQE